MKSCLLFALLIVTSSGELEEFGNYHVQDERMEEGPTNLRLETKDFVSTFMWNPDDKWNDSVPITYKLKTCNCYTECCSPNECEWVEQACSITQSYEADGTKKLSCPIPYNFLGFVGYAKVRALLPRAMRKLRMKCLCEECVCRMSDRTACISAEIRMEFSRPELSQSMTSSDEAKFNIKIPVDRLFCKVEYVQIYYRIYKRSSTQNVSGTTIKEAKIPFRRTNNSNCTENVTSTVIEVNNLEAETDYNMQASFTVFDSFNSPHPSPTTSLNFTTPSNKTTIDPLPTAVICVLLAGILLIVLYLTHYKMHTICRPQETHWKPPEFDDLNSYLVYLFNGDEFSMGQQFHDDHPADLISKYPVEEQSSSPQKHHIETQDNNLQDELQYSPEEDLINVDIDSQEQIMSSNKIYEHSDVLTSSNPRSFSSGYVAKESL